MRRLEFIVTGALVGGLGCATSRRGPAGGTSGYAQAQSDFESAYDSVKSGVRDTATAGKLAFRGVGQGAVEVTDQSKEAISRAGSKVEDGWITTKVKTELATTKGVHSGNMHVDTDSGVVRLSGTVDSPLGGAARDRDRAQGQGRRGGRLAAAVSDRARGPAVLHAAVAAVPARELLAARQ